MLDLQTCWKNVLEKVKEEISNLAFNTWFKNIEPIKLSESELILLVEDPIHKEQLDKKYLRLLECAVNETLGRNDIDVSIVTQNMLSNINGTDSSVAAEKSLSEYNLKSNYIFDNFVIGSSNKIAHAAAVAVAENPGNSYNPLFLYGDSGLGKTHLMHAIAHYILEQTPISKVLYASCEQFTNELISAIKNNTTEEFKIKYRKIDVLLVDDIQFITDKDTTQEEFFHTFNDLFNLEKQIIISSDRHPDEIKTLTERLRSRFACGLIADIKPPDFETRTAIIEKKAENLGVVIPKEVSQFIAQSVKSNIRDLEGALNRVLAYVNLTNQALNLELAQEALKDILTSKVNYQLNIDAIKSAVASHFNLKLEDIDSRKRTKDIAAARQVAMYICRELLDETFENIGNNFKRDYTTVISNTQVIENKIKENPAFNQEITSLMEKIKQR